MESQQLLKFFLKGKYDTCFAVSVFEAKNELLEMPVAMILLDISLVGDEDGLDLVRYLRAQERWKKLPVIAVTAHAAVMDKKNCIEAGCNDYLSKPIKQLELIAKIEKYI